MSARAAGRRTLRRAPEVNRTIGKMTQVDAIDATGDAEACEEREPKTAMLRGWRRYPAVVIRYGSIAVAIAGSAWLVERAFDIDLGLI